MDTNKSFNESRLLIQDQYFLNENSLCNIFLMQYIKWDALARIDFVNCNFEKIDLLGKIFKTCSFQNCRFNYFNVRKGKFSSCHFENCKITNCDIAKTEFYDTHFENCEFLDVDLTASDFHSCFKK